VDCGDHRHCHIAYKEENPCIIYECENICLWKKDGGCDYIIEPPSESCPTAECTFDPPTPKHLKKWIIIGFFSVVVIVGLLFGLWFGRSYMARLVNSLQDTFGTYFGWNRLQNEEEFVPTLSTRYRHNSADPIAIGGSTDGEQNQWFDVNLRTPSSSLPSALNGSDEEAQRRRQDWLREGICRFSNQD
jgi:hypothetical protein